MIDNYVQATRGRASLAVVDQAAIEHYRAMFERTVTTFKAILECDIAPPSLIVVYSPVANAESLRIQEDWYTVYDQYLGQVMNRLNRLYFEEPTQGEIDAYLAKLFSLRHLGAGQLTWALEFAGLHLALKDYLTQADATTSTRRLRSTSLQELYVMAHELAHTMYRTNEAALSYFRATYVPSLMRGAEELNNVAGAVSRSEQIEVMVAKELEDFDAAFERRTGHRPTPSDPEREEFAGLTRQRYEELPETDYVRLAMEILTDAHILEECVCDGMATLIVIAVCRDVAEASEASFLALHHLRLLKTIDEFTVRLSEGPDPQNLADRETSLRIRAFRLFLRPWAYVDEDDEKATKGGLRALVRRRKGTKPSVNLQAVVRGTNDAYYRKIFDDVIYPDRFVRRARYLIENELGDIRPGLSTNEMREAVLRICGLEELIDRPA